MAEEKVVYAKLNLSCPDPPRRTRNETPKPAGHHFWNSPYMFGLLFLTNITLLCVSGWLAADSISDDELRQKLSRSLETQRNLTQTLQEANQRVTCLRGAISASDQTPECPPGWTFVNQKCYFLSSDKKTREDSERSCVENGAVLATVRSKDSILKCHMQSQNAEFWVGLEQRITWTGDVAMTQWIWSDNTTESSLADSQSTQCAKMGQTIALSPCSDLLPWICERKPNKSNLLDKANAC